MLEEERIIEFQALYKKHFGKELTKEEAMEKADELIRTVKLLYKPITEKELIKLEKRKGELKKYKYIKI